LSWIKSPDDKPVILVCRTDKRSTQAAALLHEAGFRDVRAPRRQGGKDRRRPAR
jgi:rhodanese-related sulfurtransferase